MAHVILVWEQLCCSYDVSDVMGWCVSGIMVERGSGGSDWGCEVWTSVC